MRTRIKGTLAVLAFILTTGGMDAQASPFHFAEHTPGYDIFAAGQRAYRAGFHFSAFHKFRRAAHWADKMAQHNVGVMYYRGQSVDRDPARAWAWFELSAERDYPELVGIANAVWDELEPGQRKRAQRILEEELEPRYGDEVAVPRTARRMEEERKNVVGSRTGFVGNVMVYDVGTVGGRTGEEYFNSEKWDFHKVMQREKQVFEALARGRVTIGDLEFVDDEDAESSEGDDGERN
jgi:hypothetical protein